VNWNPASAGLLFLECRHALEQQSGYAGSAIDL
jgi:hypothetical protein